MPPTFGQEQFDYLRSFDAGMNAGIDPSLLPPNQLALATNATVRGTFVKPRAQYRKLALDLGLQQELGQLLKTGRWQGGCYFRQDGGTECLMAAINGRLLQFTPSGTAATVAEKTTTDTNPSTVDKAWLWQAESWVIWN